MPFPGSGARRLWVDCFVFMLNARIYGYAHDLDSFNYDLEVYLKREETGKKPVFCFKGSWES